MKATKTKDSVSNIKVFKIALLAVTILFYLVVAKLVWDSVQHPKQHSYQKEPISFSYPDKLNSTFDSFSKLPDLGSSRHLTSTSCEKLPSVKISEDFAVPNAFINIDPIAYPPDADIGLKSIAQSFPYTAYASIVILLVILIWRTCFKRILKQLYSKSLAIPTLFIIAITSNVLIVSSVIVGILFFSHYKVIKHKNYRDYYPYIEFVRNTDKTLSAIGWSRNPASTIDRNLIINGIIDEISNKNIYAAAQDIDLLLDEYGLSEFRESVYLHAAKTAFNKIGGLESSLYYSTKALALNDDKSNRNLIEHLKTIYAYRTALECNYQIALNILVEEDHWDPENLYSVWVSILTNHLRSAEVLDEEGSFVKSRIRNAYDILHTYLGYAYRTSNINLQDNIHCLYVHAMKLYAQELFQDGEKQQAADLALKALDHMPDNQETVSFLGNVYHSMGIDSFNNGNTETAISYFEKALERLPQNDELKSHLSTSMMSLAQELFQDGEKQQAADLALKALDHMPDDQETVSFLGNTYYSMGIDSFNNGNTETAIGYFEKALKLLPQDNGLKCHFSTLLMSLAMDYAFQGHFESAEINYQRAKGLCVIDGMDKRIGEINIMHGEWFMKNGDYESARKSFNKAKKSDSSEVVMLASLLHDDTYRAPGRYRVIEKAIEWADDEVALYMPNISGSICSKFDEDTGKCTAVRFYKGIKLIGLADPKMQHVEIENNSQVIVLEDNQNDGRIDTVEFGEKKKRRRLIDADGDHKLDAEMTFGINGNLLDYTKYSGRVLIRIPSGVASGGDIDYFSGPDLYLIIEHNHEYVGHTETVRNDHFPSWKKAFCIDYKKGDRVIISMWDDDSGFWKDVVGCNEDDFIDVFLIRNYPQSKILIGGNKRAAIEIRTSPTHLPPGVYEVDNSEEVNIFKHGNFDEFIEGEVIHSITNQANMSKETSELNKTILTWTIPEIVVYAAMSEASIIYQIAASFAGTEILSALLESKNEE